MNEEVSRGWQPAGAKLGNASAGVACFIFGCASFWVGVVAETATFSLWSSSLDLFDRSYGLYYKIKGVVSCHESCVGWHRMSGAEPGE